MTPLRRPGVLKVAGQSPIVTAELIRQTSTFNDFVVDEMTFLGGDLTRWL